jgi:hypothetical protein
VSNSLQPSEEVLWRQYNSYLGLYRFYVSSVIKLNVFHFAITGAVLSFYLAHTSDKSLRLALILPFFLSISLVAIFGWGCLRANDLTIAITELNARLATISTVEGFRPATEALWGLLLIFALQNVFTAIGLAALIGDMVPFQ